MSTALTLFLPGSAGLPNMSPGPKYLSSATIQLSAARVRVTGMPVPHGPVRRSFAQSVSIQTSIVMSSPYVYTSWSAIHVSRG